MKGLCQLVHALQAREAKAQHGAEDITSSRPGNAGGTIIWGEDRDCGSPLLFLGSVALRYLSATSRKASASER